MFLFFGVWECRAHLVPPRNARKILGTEEIINPRWVGGEGGVLKGDQGTQAVGRNT